MTLHGSRFPMCFHLPCLHVYAFLSVHLLYADGEVFSEAFHNAEFPMSPQSGSESRPSTSGNNSQGDEADGMPPRKKVQI